MVRRILGHAALVGAVLTVAACGTQYDNQRSAGGGPSDLQKLVAEQNRAIEELRREQESLRGTVEELQYRMGPAGRPMAGAAPSYSNPAGNYGSPGAQYPPGAALPSSTSGMPPYGTATPPSGTAMPPGMGVPGGEATYGTDPAPGNIYGTAPTGTMPPPAGDVAGDLWSNGVQQPATAQIPSDGDGSGVTAPDANGQIPGSDTDVPANTPPSVTAVPVAPWSAGPVPSVPNELVGTPYELGVRGLIGGGYDVAIQDLRTFIHENGGSSYADDAQYWIGEAYFRKGQFPRAIIEFNQVSMTYGTGDRAAAALVREAESFQMMGDRVDARLSLQKVISRYPGTDEAARASRMLGDIGG